MSDMQPVGTPLVMLDGVERHVLFTLSVVDELQAKYDMTVPEIFEKTGIANKERSQVTTDLVMALINNAVRTGRCEGDPVTEEYVKDNIDMIILPRIHNQIARSYGYSVPEPDDEDDESDSVKEPSSSMSPGSSISEQKSSATRKRKSSP